MCENTSPAPLTETRSHGERQTGSNSGQKPTTSGRATNVTHTTNAYPTNQNGAAPTDSLNQNTTSPVNLAPYNMHNGAYPNSYFSPYNANYGTSYMSGFGTGFGSYGAGYAGTPPFGFNARQHFSAGQVLNDARQTSEMVMSGMNDAMARFARVSSMIEDVLRNLHMLFDALFGLGYSLNAFRHEAKMWLSAKTGPFAVVAKIMRRASSVWRLLCLFFMSPLAGRFSPIALVLRILGLVPEDDPFEVALEGFRRRRGKATRSTDQTAGDSSSL